MFRLFATTFEPEGEDEGFNEDFLIVDSWLSLVQVYHRGFKEAFLIL